MAKCSECGVAETFGHLLGCSSAGLEWRITAVFVMRAATATGAWQRANGELGDVDGLRDLAIVGVAPV